MVNNSEQRYWRFRMFLLHVAMLLAPVTLLVAHARGYGVCLFKTIFGIDCPACGITRSVMAMFNGSMTEAFRFHPAGPVVLGIVGIITLYLAIVLFTKHKGMNWWKEVKAYRVLEGVVVIALLVSWSWKLLTN